MIGKGKWHIPALAFVLGGILSFQTGFTYVCILIVLGGWLFLHRQHSLLLAILIFFFFGWLYLSFPTPNSSSSSNVSSFNGKIISEVEQTPFSVQMILRTAQGKKVLLLYYKEEKEPFPVHWKHGAMCKGEGARNLLKGLEIPGSLIMGFICLKKAFITRSYFGTTKLSHVMAGHGSAIFMKVENN